MRRAIAEASRACCSAVLAPERRLRGHVSEASQGNRRGGAKARVVFIASLHEIGSVDSTHKAPKKGQLNRHTRYRPATNYLANYHTKHRTSDWRCHRGRVARWTNSHRRGFSRIRPPPPAFQPHHIYQPHADSSHNWPSRAPSK